MDPLARTILRALDELGIERTRPVVIACSGGADSMALAHVAIELWRRGSLGPVTVCHVDHQLRAESRDEGDLVAAMVAAANEQGPGPGPGPALDRAEMVREVVEVAAKGRSLEEAAREVRYAALLEVARARGDAYVFTGHTRDDQAETVLLRLVVGTGLAGLAGVRVQRGAVVRPQLLASRAETAAYCARLALAVVDDPMNHDLRFPRVRAREVWLPLLRETNPKVTSALAAIAKDAAGLAEALDYAAICLRERAHICGAQGALSAEALAEAPPLVRAQLFTAWARELGGARLSRRHQVALERLVSSASRGGTAHLDLPGMVALREYDAVRLEPVSPAEEPSAEVLAPELAVEGPAPPYLVRLSRPGDRMKPVRLKGRSRKLSHLYIDAKVPRRLRATARVVTGGPDGEIEWAEHIGPAHGSRVHVTLTPHSPVATNKDR